MSCPCRSSQSSVDSGVATLGMPLVRRSRYHRLPSDRRRAPGHLSARAAALRSALYEAAQVARRPRDLIAPYDEQAAERLGQATAPVSRSRASSSSAAPTTRCRELCDDAPRATGRAEHSCAGSASARAADVKRQLSPSTEPAATHGQRRCSPPLDPGFELAVGNESGHAGTYQQRQRPSACPFARVEAPRPAPRCRAGSRSPAADTPPRVDGLRFDGPATPQRDDHQTSRRRHEIQGPDRSKPRRPRAKLPRNQQAHRPPRRTMDTDL